MLLLGARRDDTGDEGEVVQEGTRHEVDVGLSLEIPTISDLLSKNIAL